MNRIDELMDELVDGESNHERHLAREAIQAKFAALEQRVIDAEQDAKDAKDFVIHLMHVVGKPVRVPQYLLADRSLGITLFDDPKDNCRVVVPTINGKAVMSPAADAGEGRVG